MGSDGHAIAVVALTIAEDHIQTIHAVADPDKLRHIGGSARATRRVTE